jgi:hypothetical protein
MARFPIGVAVAERDKDDFVPVEDSPISAAAKATPRQAFGKAAMVQKARPGLVRTQRSAGSEIAHAGHSPFGAIK